MLIPVAVMGSGEPPILLSQAFSMSAQQIKDSTLTPHEIIPAPGAGKMIVPTMFVFNFEPGATPFSSGGGELEFVYGHQNLNVLAQILVGPADVRWVFHSLSSGWVEGGDPADYLNQAVKLRADLRGSIAVVIAALGDPGVDYAVGDTGTVDDGSPDATYVVDTIGDAGSVVSYTITDGGDGYSVHLAGLTGPSHTASTWTTTPGGAQPGVGSGFVVAVTEVDASASAGDGTLSGIIYYLVADMA